MKFLLGLGAGIFIAGSEMTIDAEMLMGNILLVMGVIANLVIWGWLWKIRKDISTITSTASKG
jgi:hypothetical protein